MIVGPCSKGSCGSCDDSSGLNGGPQVLGDPPGSLSLAGDCPRNSPHATARVK